MSDQRERESHAVRRVRLDAKAASLGLGGTPTRVSRYPKGYRKTLLARVIGMFYNPVSSNLRPSAGEARVLSITAKRQLMLSNNVCSLDFSIKIK